MIILHDPRDGFSRAFVATLPQDNSYTLVDWSDPVSQQTYMAVRAFPTVLVTLSDGAMQGLIDCQSVGAHTWSDFQSIDLSVQVLSGTDDFGNKLSTVSPTDSRVQQIGNVYSWLIFQKDETVSQWLWTGARDPVPGRDIDATCTVVRLFPQNNDFNPRDYDVNGNYTGGQD